MSIIKEEIYRRLSYQYPTTVKQLYLSMSYTSVTIRKHLNVLVKEGKVTQSIGFGAEYFFTKVR
jgi:DeoR/GlpR family transcriptional regulator of sugar metabolism